MPPTWPVRLHFCESCGLTQLVDSCPPEVLYANYVTLSSWKPQPHAVHEIEMLSRLGALGPNTRVVEIGSNDGGFMVQLTEAGCTDIVGVEPSQDAYDLALAKGLTVVKEFLSPALARSMVADGGQFDLFVSRQNLEHIADLRVVAESMEVLLKPGGWVLIELPNFGCNLDWTDYSLWEEHVNYFTTDTLRDYLSLAGIEIVHQEIILFSGEGIVVIGRKTGNAPRSREYLPALRERNVAYAARWPAFRDAIARELGAIRASGKRIAVYGAGSRAFCLINFAGLASFMDIIVDDQTEKQGRFMPQGRLPIMSSDALYENDIGVCLLTVNAENEGKVIAKNARWVEAGGQFWSVFPPSDNLLPIWAPYQPSTSRHRYAV